jgi:hypothetical protein
MGSQKVPGMVVLHWNGRTYSNAYQIAFRVGSLHIHRLASSSQPLLEAPTEDFFWNLPEFDRRVRYVVPLKVHFHSREQPKSLGEIRRVRWLDYFRNYFLGEELLRNRRCVSRCIIMMQEPVSLQTVASLLPNCITQPCKTCTQNEQ